MDSYNRFLRENGNFIYGINLPWFGISKNRSCTFGASPFDGAKAAYDHSDAKLAVENIAAIGFTCIRTWVFTGLGGTVLDESGKVIGLSDDFISNLTDFLEIIKQNGLTVNLILMPHIIQSVPFNPDNLAVNAAFQKTAMKTVTNEEYRRAFIDNALIPALEAIKGYEDIIICMDLYCEPEGDAFETTGKLDMQTHPGRVEKLSELTDFIKAESDAVKAVMPEVKRLVSCSFGQNYLKFNTYKAYNIDILGLDIYNNESETQIPEARITDDVRKAIPEVWVTECNYSQKKADIMAVADWKEEQFAEIIVNFYENAKKNGYTACFMWHYAGSNGVKTSLTENTKTADYSAVRLSGRILHYNILDWNKKIGKLSGPEKPALLANGNSRCLRWLASRDALKYEIQYKADNEWKTLETVNKGDKKYIRNDTVDFYSNEGDNRLYEYMLSGGFETGKQNFRISALVKLKDEETAVYSNVI